MLIAGSLLALICGLSNSAAATLEKLVMVRSGTTAGGLSLLRVLVRQPLWLLAMGLSVLAWVAEAAALGLAPVPVVTTLRTSGRGGLVLAGHRWLGERFAGLELVGIVMLAAGGVLTASSASSISAAAAPLSNLTELLVALVTIVVAALITLSKRGVVMGAAVGVLYVATGVFTKEVGDRFVREGAEAVPALLATPGPWLMVALSVWAIALTQRAMVRANAATVSAASTTISANGLIVAGVILYRQPVAGRGELVYLVIGIVISAAGALALAAREITPQRQPEQTLPTPTGKPLPK